MTPAEAGREAARDDWDAWPTEARREAASHPYRSPFGGHGYGGWWDEADALAQMGERDVAPGGETDADLASWRDGYVAEIGELAEVEA